MNFFIVVNWIILELLFSCGKYLHIFGMYDMRSSPLRLAMMQESSNDALNRVAGSALKYEQIRLHSYTSVAELRQQIGSWMDFYNHERDPQHLGYTTPWSNYEGTAEQAEAKAA